MAARWGSLHTHSQYSALDGTTPVPALVAKAAKLDYPFLGLSDHGNMAGVTQLYKECRKHDVLPYPGFEGYLMNPTGMVPLDHKDASKIERFHLGLYARTTRGYQGLVAFNAMTYTRPRFSRFPRFTLDDLQEFGESYGDDVILTTGCFFGWMQQSLVRDGFSHARNVLRQYQQTGMTVIVELQNHGIKHGSEGGQFDNDDDLVKALVQLADREGVPYLCTQDNHYLEAKQKRAHTMMKKMTYGSTEDGFPGDSFHLPSSEWVEDHYPADVWAKNLDTCKMLVDINEVELPPLDNYAPRLPPLPKAYDRAVKKGWTPDDILRTLCDRAVGGNPTANYLSRLEYELGVIKAVGFANYFLHVKEIVDWCKQENICIEARGSAVGSFVCYLLKITQADPLKWGLSFDRFLATDRTSPPDIDLDVEDAERVRILEMLTARYGSTRIGTFGLLGFNDDGTGSILRTYQTYRARLAEQAGKPKGPEYAKYQTMDDVKKHHPGDYTGLSQLDQMGSVYRSYGVHASGVLLNGDEFEIRDWIPTMLVASSNTTVTQFGQKDVEAWGLLKDDILGQSSLTVMKRCQRLMGREDPTDFTWIPDDDRETCAFMAKGIPDSGVFHQEAPGKSRGSRELRIRYTKDCVLLMALFMPGAMNSGQKDIYLRGRRDKDVRDSVKYLHPAFEKALRSTYGAVIYQDQVLDILRGLGMDIPTINTMFKVVKDSGRGSGERNATRLAEMHTAFDKAATTAGVKKDDLSAAWEQTAGMVAYGFGKAHATGYGLRAYRTAYLKTHNPREYMAALLDVWAGTDKEAIYVRECRRMGIGMAPPNVNTSTLSWTLDGKVIRKGLLSIKGIGQATAQAIVDNQPYVDLDDMVDRLTPRQLPGGRVSVETGTLSGALEKLDTGGALRDLAG